MAGGRVAVVGSLCGRRSIDRRTAKSMNTNFLSAASGFLCYIVSSSRGPPQFFADAKRVCVKLAGSVPSLASPL